MKNQMVGVGALLCASLLAAGCDTGTQEEQPQPETGEGQNVNEAVDVQDQAQDPDPAQGQDQAAAECEPGDGLTYLCGLRNAEDLLQLGNSGLILASGMSTGQEPGNLYLIDPADDSYRELMTEEFFSRAHDETAYPNCPGPLPQSNYSIHGLSLNEYETDRFDLYVTGHGEREAIEIFDLDMSGAAPALTWEGCVVLPDGTFANSVAILSDGGFVTTKMMDPAEGFAPILSEQISGLVYEWHPGEEVRAVEGTELSGANGIAMSEDGRYMYVAAFGTREIVKFDMEASPIGKETVSVDIVPDNIRWTQDGMLLTAGNNYIPEGQCVAEDCETGWSVVEIDPDTLETTTVASFDETVGIQGVSTALLVDGDYWVGTFDGDRVAYFPAQTGQ